MFKIKWYSFLIKNIKIFLCIGNKQPYYTKKILINNKTQVIRFLFITINLKNIFKIKSMSNKTFTIKSQQKLKKKNIIQWEPKKSVSKKKMSIKKVQHNLSNNQKLKTLNFCKLLNLKSKNKAIKKRFLIYKKYKFSKIKFKNYLKD